MIPFSRKLFLSVLTLFLAFAACFLAYQYQRERAYKVELLDLQLQHYNEQICETLYASPDSLPTACLESYTG